MHETDGLINVLKPPGMTSHDVVHWIRKILGIRRIGHAGTLDPGVAGVLVVAVGRATRLTEFIMDLPKTYRAEMTLGITTTTQDAFGEVLQNKPPGDLSYKQVISVLESFLGEIQQVPPMVSAVKVAGHRLYQLAREGKETERQPRTVTVYNLKPLRWYSSQYPRVLFDVQCSKGTYIRTLCHDAGAILGCGAHLSFLVRTSSGGFCLEHAFSMEELAEMVKMRDFSFIQPMLFGVRHLPRLTVPHDRIQAILQGCPLSMPSNEGAFFQQGWVAIVDKDDNLLALGMTSSDSVRINVRKVLVQGEK